MLRIKNVQNQKKMCTQDVHSRITNVQLMCANYFTRCATKPKLLTAHFERVIIYLQKGDDLYRRKKTVHIYMKTGGIEMTHEKRVNDIISQITALSKNAYTQSEFLPELLKLQKELINLTFNDEKEGAK